MTKAYFVRGSQYVRYDLEADRVDPGYPRLLSDGWSGLAGTGFDSRVDDALDLGTGKVYWFLAGAYLRLDQQRNSVDQAPGPVAGNWPGLAEAGFDTVDAAVNWGDGKAYFFRGDQFVRFDLAADRVDPGYPLPIAGNWPGLAEAGFDTVDAAVNWGGGRAYFFRADQYVRYDVAADRVDPGYPLPIAGNWPGLAEAGFDTVDAVWVKLPVEDQGAVDPGAAATKPGRKPGAGVRPIAGNWPGLAEAGFDTVDVAVNWGGGKAYFFRADQYVRYDVAADRVDPGYPLPIAGNWPGLAEAGFDTVDAVVNWPNGKAYFFRGDQYVRYDIAADRVDPD